jgi:uncharacterized protein YjbJ (UPF0337 family)
MPPADAARALPLEDAAPPTATTEEIMTDRLHDDRTLGDEGVENNLEGKAKDLKGRLKDAAGALTGDHSLQAEGKIDRLKGAAQDALGDAQRKVDRLDR